MKDNTYRWIHLIRLTLLILCFQGVIQGKYVQIYEKNFIESRKASEQIIKQVFKPLEDNLGAGLYTVSGGYKTFCQDLQKMTDKYRHAEGKGVKVS